MLQAKTEPSPETEGHSPKSKYSQQPKRLKTNKDGPERKSKGRFVWTYNLHQRFIHSIFVIGLESATAAEIQKHSNSKTGSVLGKLNEQQLKSQIWKHKVALQKVTYATKTETKSLVEVTKTPTVSNLDSQIKTHDQYISAALRMQEIFMNQLQHSIISLKQMCPRLKENGGIKQAHSDLIKSALNGEHFQSTSIPSTQSTFIRPINFKRKLTEAMGPSENSMPGSFHAFTVNSAVPASQTDGLCLENLAQWNIERRLQMPLPHIPSFLSLQELACGGNILANSGDNWNQPGGTFREARHLQHERRLPVHLPRYSSFLSLGDPIQIADIAMDPQLSLKDSEFLLSQRYRAYSEEAFRNSVVIEDILTEEFEDSISVHNTQMAKAKVLAAEFDKEKAPKKSGSENDLLKALCFETFDDFNAEKNQKFWSDM